MKNSIPFEEKYKEEIGDTRSSEMIEKQHQDLKSIIKNKRRVFRYQ